VPASTLLSIPEDEQRQMLVQLRRARFGYWLSLHILLLCARGWTPTEISEALLCSRSSVYRAVKAYQRGSLFELDEDGLPLPNRRTTVLRPTYARSIHALLKKAPSVFGWCRTRWSCATLAAQLKVQRGLDVSASTMRRWLHELDYVWKRAKLVARGGDPEWAHKLARIRHIAEKLLKSEVLIFADELDIHLLPKVGYQWTLRGTKVAVMTPGQNQKQYLAGALDFRTGKLHHRVGLRKTNALFRELLDALDWFYPKRAFTKIYVVVDNFRIHDAHAVAAWLAAHPRFELIKLPTYCPEANPIERAFGDVHDKCTRNHKRTKITQLVGDVERHLEKNGPWQYKLSKIYFEPEVTAALETNAAAIPEEKSA